MDYSQFLLLKEELSLILVIVILFVADLVMSPDAHKNDGKPVLNTRVALTTRGAPPLGISWFMSNKNSSESVASSRSLRFHWELQS